jgi:hypothetical protein
MPTKLKNKLAKIVEKNKLHILCPKNFFICVRAFETIKQKWVNMSEMYTMHTLLKLLFISKKSMASHYF